MGYASFTKCKNPTGWFQVAYSDELAPGEVKALHYFNEKLVLWRGASGEVFLQDAFCAHLGAHRGIKGFVKGENLVCPWHLWEWDGEGRNTNIPYSPEGCNKVVRIRTFPVIEWYNKIMCWYDADGAPPAWELPILPEFTDPDWYDEKPSRLLNRVVGHVQMPIENMVDFAHIHPVHGSADYPVCKEIRQDGHIFESLVSMEYGGDKETTYLTPNGPVRADLLMTALGIGVATVLWKDAPWPTRQITCHTPVDDTHFDYFFVQTSKRGQGEDGYEPEGMAKAMLRVQHHVIPQDFFTWEHMKYLDNAVFAKAEADLYPVLRSWAQQFYPDTRPEWERRRQAGLKKAHSAPATAA